MNNTLPLAMTVNGVHYEREVEPRTTLVDFLRDSLALTGTHVGCEHGVCGACSVLLNDEPVRSCCMFAIQADGMNITTVEGMSTQRGQMSTLQDAFCEKHALQCGYCTPGMLVSCHALLKDNPKPSPEEVREAISGNLCRCTGYQQIVDAVIYASTAHTAESDAKKASHHVN
jgi:carbon-monoxide dehydrogenase small subunit